jgi:zinc and cadmium transporter
VVLYAVLIFLAAFLGGALPMCLPWLDEARLRLTVSLGAGLLLGMALLHMLPEAVHLIPSTFAYFFMGGFLLLLLLERFVMVHACEEHGCDFHTVGLAAFLGLTVHGAVEGFALASTAHVEGLAPLVFIAILAHKLPAGVALTSILRLSKRSRRQTWAFIIGVAASGPLGILLATVVLERTHLPNAAGILLALSAGTFLYVAACDLLPEMHRSSSKKLSRLGLFLLGVAISVLGAFAE